MRTFGTLPLLALLVGCGHDQPKRPDRQDEVVELGPLRFAHGVPKNLFVISIDTLRKDHLGRYIEGETLSPFMDQLMAEGVVLDDVVQCSDWTFNSIPCTMGGRDYVEVGFYPRFDYGPDRGPFPDGTPFLPTWLEQAGFDSWFFPTNNWFSSNWNTAQGFDHEVYVGIMYAEEVIRRSADELQAGIEGQDAPWYYHVHVKEPHAPYRAPSEFNDELDALPPIPFNLDDIGDHYELIGDTWDTLDPEMHALVEQHMRVRYRSEVAWLDAQLAEQFAELDERGLLDDTLVLIWTDHGEQFWEHGHQAHAWTLHPEETDAIAFFWAKKGLEPAVWSEPVRSVDLVPTLLDLYGVEADVPLSGYALGSAPDDRIRYSSTAARDGAATSAERDGLKLIFRWVGTIEAYDHATDPDEHVNIWDPSDPDQAALWDALRERVEGESALIPEYEVHWP